MRLFIIGNGFDLHHNLETGYRDYCRFLKKRALEGVLNDIVNSEYFVGDVENITDPDDVFWCDVESNLRFDYEAMLAQSIYDKHPYPPDESEEFPDSRQLDSMKDDAVVTEKNFKGVFDFTSSYLRQWMKSVDIERADTSDCYQFKADDLFVTFNYTLVLEQIYAVNPERVFHIHGCVNDEGWPPQFGNTEKEAIDVEMEYKERYHDDILYEPVIRPASEIYVSMAERLLKNVTDNKYRLEACFPYDNVDEVVIMGHSYQGSDIRYYKEFFIPRFKNAKWNVYCWAKNPKVNEVDEAGKFFDKHGLNGSIITW